MQAANDTNTDADKAELQKEEQPIAEISGIAMRTEFNTKKLLSGSHATVNFQIGANSGQTISVSLVAMTATN